MRATNRRRLSSPKSDVLKAPRVASYQLCKDEAGAGLGDDLIRIDSKRNIFVVVDGSSRSYAPRLWGESVAERLKRQPLIRLTDWEDVGNRFEMALDAPETQRDAKLRAFGSQATALTMRMEHDVSGATIFLESVGDCFALVCGVEEMNLSASLLWPFGGVSEFPTSPNAISSIGPHLRDGALLADHFNVSSGDLILLMSDALGRYACTEASRGSSLREAFPFLERKRSFTRWAQNARDCGRIENDDLSMIAVWVK